MHPSQALKSREVKTAWNLQFCILMNQFLVTGHFANTFNFTTSSGEWCRSANEAHDARLSPAGTYLNNSLHLPGAGEGWWGAARSLPKLSRFNSHCTDSTQWTSIQAGNHSTGLRSLSSLKGGEKILPDKIFFSVECIENRWWKQPHF